ncbi:hypothetical protein A3D77_07000 [Candidatus Gottesmanbacteria bacterium RIFCSPHIGHO2_02_FULL_39_11]|uniref:DUF4352 domain-containing protein n=1 Tax=Candidatus Gottesmanbacteria bacterium RIFCSPHIGHO2_02_FULL_39_11 TaxID=1798382 RepID=A0A1F5ZKZ8_9BACT|nr:MAG: hypothetical protein A3D77_07000 [Candidatus Gottesmanbacteria bacterium RIFCSPHIGHO2_02_FULL_39_11]
MDKNAAENDLNSTGVNITKPVHKRRLSLFLKAYKKFLIVIVIVIIGLFLISKISTPKNSTNSPSSVRSVTTRVDRSYDFSALNNQGKPIPTTTASPSRIKLTITNAEKTSQVLVGDKTFSAKNNKLFLILNLELRNDRATPANIIPGDLIRMTYGGDESRKFAPDLHNNLVPVAAISTKIDRVGFVVPDNEKMFKIYIGELEGKKDIVTIAFGS